MANFDTEIYKPVMIKAGFCLTVLLVVFLAVMLPTLADIAETGFKTAETEIETQRQDIYQKSYRHLLDRIKLKVSETLPQPKLERLTQHQIPLVQENMEKAAQRAGYAAHAITPDPSSLTDGQARLLVNAEFQGPAPRFQSLMYELGALPSLLHVEQIQVNENQGETVLKMKLWLALKKTD